MTRFYWVDTSDLAAADAAEKGYDSDKYIFCATKAELVDVTVSDYDAIYLRTGMRELEQQFAVIMRRSTPSWLC